MQIYSPRINSSMSLFRGYRLRSLLTPFTLGTFILTAATGMMLFLKLDMGLVKPVHQWSSWFLVAAVPAHIGSNRGSVHQMLLRPAGVGIVLFFVLLLYLSLLPIYPKQAAPHSTDSIASALVHSPLYTVALLANQNPEEVMARLKTLGITPRSKEQTIAQIAAYNNRPALEVLRLIVL